MSTTTTTVEQSQHQPEANLHSRKGKIQHAEQIAIDAFSDDKKDPVEKMEKMTDSEKDNVRSSVTASFLSQATTTTNLQHPLGEKPDDPSPVFLPSHTLRIEAHGIRVLRPPLPQRQLEIPIYRTDGTLAYVSRRNNWCSGDCVLSSPIVGDLLSTTYFFGPGRDPIIRSLQTPPPPAYYNNTGSGSGTGGGDEASTITLSGKWTSRSTTFSTLDGHVFEWRYAQDKDPSGHKAKLLILLLRQDPVCHGTTATAPTTAHHLSKKPFSFSSSEAGHDKILAQLVRSKETRTPGSSKCRAGNGGMLVLSRDAWQWLDEALIVATCLVMLKREVDRRRMLQMAMATGGG